MMNQSGFGAGFEARLRTLRILWALFLTTIGLYVLVTFFARPSADVLAEGGRDNPTLLIALAVAGLTTVVISFVLKRHFYERAAERRDPAQFQQGFIFAVALCEMSALYGLVALFVTWNNYAYILFALGALGIALHFPRREDVAAIYYKR